MRRFDELVALARKTNAYRDETERKAGFTSPAQCLLSHQLRTVMSALEAGMNTEDWNCVAEGYVMLEHAELVLRSLEKHVSAN